MYPNDAIGIYSIGVDGDETIKNNKEYIHIHDYTLGEYNSTESFDLAYSTEFLEHVEEEYMPNYMKTFQCAKSAVVTYAPPGWDGHHHVNLQEEDYWVAKFSEYGFILNESKTKELRANSTLNLGKKGRKAFVKNRGLFFDNAK